MGHQVAFAIIFLGAIILAGVASYFVFAEGALTNGKSDMLCWNDEDCITIELMNTPFSREKGLMNRPSLEEDTGALFVYDEFEIQGMWMQNMVFPLDIIWMNNTGHITGIVEEAPPCSVKPCKVYYSPGPVGYAVEVNAGYSKKHNLSVGDNVELPRGVGI